MDGSNSAAQWREAYRAPAPRLLIAAAVGITLDRTCCMPVATWLALAACCLTLARSVFNRAFGRGIWLLATMVPLSAAWHQLHWFSVPVRDVSRLCPLEYQAVPVQIAGTALTSPAAVSTQPLPGAPMSSVSLAQFRVRAAWLQRSDTWQPISGCFWVHVVGDLPNVLPGDHVEVAGNLMRYQRPMNPGETDFHAVHWAQGERVFLEVPVAACVRVLRSPHLIIGSCLARCRAYWIELLRRKLNPAAAQLAGALLLGARDGLDGDERDRYLRTGTVHVLSISGLHVGILAIPWLFVARAGLVPFRTSIVSVMGVVALYARLVDGRAPVMRAGILIQVVCFGWLTRRRVTLANSLCLAGLIVLVANPSELFSPGTQLSFLSVAVLSLSPRVRWHRLPTDPLDRLVWQTRPKYWQLLRTLAGRVANMVLASLSVWLVTAPLVVETFHVLSPLAIPLNFLVFLPLAIGLQTGFLLLLLADAVPWLSYGLARVCEWSLSGMHTLVQRADQWPYSSYWLTGPGIPAVLACYVVLGWGSCQRSRRRVWISYVLATSCLIGGWSHQAWQRYQHHDRLRCSFLSVGHGTCVVLQLPGGEVWLYDAGRRGSARYGVDCVSRYLWSQGIGRIDAIVLSHSDLDHYSLIPGLVDRFGCKRVYCGPAPFRRDHPGEDWLMTELSRRSVVPKRVQSDIQWEFAGGCRVSVLHPGRHDDLPTDNARSLVLQLDYHERSILLPGDLEQEGMDALLALPRRHVDVAMAPHHGSADGEPMQFLSWCDPEWCVISGRDRELNATWAAAQQALGTQLLHTAIDGAVEVDIGATSSSIHPFRSTSKPQTLPLRFRQVAQPREQITNQDKNLPSAEGQ